MRVNLCIAVGLIGLSACGDTQEPPSLGPNAVTQVVGTGGGSLSSKDGTLTVVIPAGALAASRTISIDEIATGELGSAFAGKTVLRAFELGPSGTTFDKPIMVAVRSTQKATVTDSTARIPEQMLWTTENGTATRLDSVTLKVRSDSITVSGAVRHFSPLVLTSESSVADIRIFNIPPVAEVNRPFDINLLATFSDVSGVAVPTWINVLYTDDNSTLVRPQFPNALAILLPQNNRVESPLTYMCPQAGDGFLKAKVHGTFTRSQFAAQNPGERVFFELDSRSRRVQCLPRTAQLTIDFMGNGEGRVEGGPVPSFTCTTDCTQRLLETATAELRAFPEPGSVFTGFSGQCAGSGTPGVVEPIRMVADRLCQVTFMKAPTFRISINRTGLGTGTVQGVGLDCGEKCVVDVPQGTQFELRATPAIGSRFATWGSGCPTTTPNAPIIIFPVNGPISCDALFPLENLNIGMFPSEARIRVGGQQRLNVNITDETGIIGGRTITFVSLNPSVATVDGEGNVTGVAPGMATITATVHGPGGGNVSAVVHVSADLRTLTVRKTGFGQGTFTIVNPVTGEESLICGPDCFEQTGQFELGSVLHVLASPGIGSRFVRFLEGCVASASDSTRGIVTLNSATVCGVEFGTAGPLSIAFGGLTSKSSGLSVAIGNVSGTVYADYDVQNPTSDSLNIHARIDNAYAAACFRANLLGTRVRCEIQTDRFDSLGIYSRGIFPNGLRNLSLVAQYQSGAPAATVNQDITLNNQNFFRVRTNNPVGATSTTWRAGEMKITVHPVFFDVRNFDALTASLSVTPLSGSGTLTFGDVPAANPFEFTANPANSPTAQGRFLFSPSIFEGGTDITSFFAPIPPIEQNIDMVPPIVPLFSLPGNTFISGGVLVLDFPTGPYPVGSRIPLSRISGGRIVAAHLPFCANAHVHNTINIRREGSAEYDGPYTDPRLGADCGHGSIEAENFTDVAWSFGGTLTDVSPLTTTVRMFRGVNGCDAAGPSVFDDVPILTGSGPGQSNNPFGTFVGNSFSGLFSMNVDPTVADDFVCFRIDVQDAAVGPDGQPANRVFQMLQTQLKAYAPPLPPPPPPPRIVPVR